MSDRADLAAGVLFAGDPGADRAENLRGAGEAFARILSPSSVWRTAHLPPELRGEAAFGDELPRWRSEIALTLNEERWIRRAWGAALLELGRGRGDYLRLRVENVDEIERLRTLRDVDGLRIVPSLDSLGRTRSLVWRWPMLVGVAPGPTADERLSVVRQSEHHGTVFDAELGNPARTYEIVLVQFTDLTALSANWLACLDDAACVIVAGDVPANEQLTQLESLVQPAITVAFTAPVTVWWRDLFHGLSHDNPIDVAVEFVVRMRGVDGLVAGPRLGLDITASAHWFAALAPELPPGVSADLALFASWYWGSEGEGATKGSRATRRMRANGMDPRVIIPALTGSARPYERGEGVPAPELAETRQLRARVYDGQTAMTSVLPPQKSLKFAVRIAIPEDDDVPGSVRAPVLPNVPSPTVVLDVVVTGNVWAEPQEAQELSISRLLPTKPSTSVSFAFDSPPDGSVVTIEILVLYQGKPLRRAVYEAPVRADALPGETATLTEYPLSGPNEPVEQSRPVAVTLDGTGSDITRVGHPGRVRMGDVQALLDRIEERVSRILGSRDAPPTFDHPEGLRLLIELARIGHELKLRFAALDIGDTDDGINVLVGDDAPVLPLELVYSAPAPRDDAVLCPHDSTPPLGQSCAAASAHQVCPYAFWGLRWSIARTVQWRSDPLLGAGTWPSSISVTSVLYGASVIADAGAAAPLPTDAVLRSARKLFDPVIRVSTWEAWRNAVQRNQPNLLVVLGHALDEGGTTNLYIGAKSALARYAISSLELSAAGGTRPLVLLIACASATRGDPFGTLPGTLTANGALAVVGTLSKINGPDGAHATTHLLQALRELADDKPAGGPEPSVGDAVLRARRSLIANRRPIGLLLVSHGDLDPRVTS